MPCPDLVSGKSVPPKKLHFWRSNNIAPTRHSALDSTPDSQPLNMGSNTIQSDSQNGNGFDPPRNSPEDMPLDFSLKPEPKGRPSYDAPASPQGGQPGPELSSYGHSYTIPNGRKKGGHYFFDSIARKNVRESVVSPRRDERTGGFFFRSHSEEPQDFEAMARQTIRSPSPPLHSPNSSSKSPILAGMLSRNPPDMLSVLPVDATRLLSLGYPNSMCLSAAIQSANSVIAHSALFPPSNVVAPSGMAFMQAPMNLLPPVSPLSGKVENKAPRKAKQERPFKNYDVSLQDDLQCNSLPWPVNFQTIRPRPSEARSASPEALHSSAPRSAPNGISDCSSHSEPSPADNVPHSSGVPSHSPREDETSDTAKERGRKRKPVADSEKDASYWERRKKNNQAAKRSRENRRIKEDTVAQQALFFRNESTKMTQIVFHQGTRIQELTMKLASLEQDKLALTAENAMYKQILAQKMCGECGSKLCNKLLL